MVRHHVLITGTGRAGTTYLMQVFTKLGLNTGFKDSEYQLDPNANAGLEMDIDDARCPYIVKRPHFCDSLDNLAQRTDINIDHVIIPIRDLYSASQSRRENVRKAGPGAIPQNVTGGLSGTADAEKQEEVLMEQIYALMLAIAKHDIPHTLLIYPRLVQDYAYLFSKVRFLLGGITEAQFTEAHKAIYRPDLVHDYSQQRHLT